MGGPVDADHDGLDDTCEAALAQEFAPIVIHSSAETNFPTDVDDFLASTALSFRDDACDAADALVTNAPDQDGLLRHTSVPKCGGGVVTSDGSRSERKHRTFFLGDVAEPVRRGNADSQRWTTYVHIYPSAQGGVTLQYWRFYAFNEAFADHGGDWEGEHIVLRADGTVRAVRLLGHSSIDELSPRELAWSGTHPLVYSEIGSHTSRATGDRIAANGCIGGGACDVTLDDARTFVRQETWSGGNVSWPDGHVTSGGGLLNVGEKSAPMNGQSFIKYSGLWGSPGRFYITSGYWGPAFNETSMRADGFVTAWCAGMAGPLDQRTECWAATTER
jgi:prepilin-type processing-associated H-X9-DG protein